MKNPARILVACLLVLGLALNLAPAAIAQTVTATLTGTVSDQIGRTGTECEGCRHQPGYQDRVQLPSRTTRESTRSRSCRLANMSSLLKLSGFKKMVTNPIKLEVNQTARVDLKLELGEVTQVVDVEGVAPVLQTESTTVGQVISGNTIVNLPLNGRNFQQLTLIATGRD